jgi:uncharacterized protein (TIGR04255 family)
MPNEIQDPFNDDAPPSVPLPRTPLTGVLAQVRFPEVLSISKPEYIAEFQERIRSAFPISRQEPVAVFQVDGEGAQHRTVHLWRFLDRKSEWRVTLSTSFIAIETRAYADRADFVARLKEILSALETTISPNLVGRVGVRYVDRVYGDAFDKVDDLIRNEVLGVGAGATHKGVQRSMNEALCVTKEGNLLARWGFMPADHTHDPDMMPPIRQRSWFLDIDSFREEPEFASFDAEEISKLAYALATRAYVFFRWAVTDKLLRDYGGAV